MPHHVTVPYTITALIILSSSIHNPFSFARDGKLVEPSPDIERELKSDLDKIAKQYGGGAGVDMTKFPTFKFTDPVLDPITSEQQK